jgi:FkbM family methyltransferase
MIKKAIRILLNRLGYSVYRLRQVDENMLGHRDPIADQAALLQGITEPCIMDAGAYIGEISLAYQRFFPRARIIALEPFPNTFSTLCAKTKGRNIECLELALSGISGKSSLQIYNHRPANSLLQPHPERAATWGKEVLDKVSQVNIETRTLEDLFLMLGLEHLDVLKLDVQGMEYDILNAAMPMLKQGKVNLLYLEIIIMPTYQNQHTISEYLHLLYEAGFELFNIYNLSSVNGQLRQVDALFKFKLND